ncbi:type II/IV secretion system family protein 2 (plasmid) [Achromobacter xylosoxidans]|uniref:ATPase, T2SS/T4P/T4SS family n=1 Tax=Alcaligenes xylosoxydans xylosoxydans TaxID=85698 RepID=UPI000DD139E4|nr:ATPase, T2SS/T4P/T4SS family [Achromobacter xylosoxidans]AXA80642.1 type II/IV secretion system family protein 2 [Achromobacter xylosoxidans]
MGFLRGLFGSKATKAPPQAEIKRRAKAAGGAKSPDVGPKKPPAAGVTRAPAPPPRPRPSEGSELTRVPTSSAPPADSTLSKTQRRVLISSENDLAQEIRFERALFKDLQLMPPTASKICPVLLESGHVVLLCQSSYMHSDQADELERLIANKLQRQMWEPARVEVTQPALILAIVRGHTDKTTLSKRRQILASPERTAIMGVFEDMIRWGVKHNAADIHIRIFDERPYSEVHFSVGGKYIAVDQFARMPTPQLQELLRVAFMDVKGAGQSTMQPQTEQQGRSLHTLDEQHRVMLRWATLAADTGVAVTQRILNLDIASRKRSFQELGYLPSHIRMLDRARVASGGAVVFSGTVGSGKSTALATAVDLIPDYRKIITFEDPVEYLLRNAIQNTITRLEDGTDPFERKLAAAKRSAMHDLVIGEIRDLISGRAFMDLAASGTNLYTTVHAGSSAQIPDRLSSEIIGVSRDFLASAGILKLLIYQALIPKLCDCKYDFEYLSRNGGEDAEGHPRDGDYWKAYADRLDRLYRIDAHANVKVRNAEGCEKCRKQGFRELFGLNDRTVVAEMIEPGIDDHALELIRRADNAGLARHYFGGTDLDYTSEDMTGKSAMDCAIFKAYRGELDPREIEPRFRSFETVEVARENAKRRVK